MAGADANPRSPGAPPALDIDGAVATFTLRRPAVANRLELADIEALLAHLDAVNADASVRVLCLRGEGKHFCSGFHIGQIGAAGAPDPGARFEALAAAIEQARPVTVAVLQGGAYGGAFDLALACDFRLGTPAVESSVPAARLGLHFYRGGLERMVARLGLAQAKRVLLAAEHFDAAALQQIGWLDRLVAADRLDAEAQAFCAGLAAMAPLALLPMKRHLNAIARGTLDAEAIARDIARASASDDLREGGLAWTEKRAPRFRGR